MHPLGRSLNLASRYPRRESLFSKCFFVLRYTPTSSFMAFAVHTAGSTNDDRRCNLPDHHSDNSCPHSKNPLDQGYIFLR